MEMSFNVWSEINKNQFKITFEKIKTKIFYD